MDILKHQLPKLWIKISTLCWFTLLKRDVKFVLQHFPKIWEGLTSLEKSREIRDFLFQSQNFFRWLWSLIKEISNKIMEGWKYKFNLIKTFNPIVPSFVTSTMFRAFFSSSLHRGESRNLTLIINVPHMWPLRLSICDLFKM